MKKTVFSLYLMLTLVLSVPAQVQSPSQFLPNYGKQTTYYHQAENYFKHLTEKSTLIKHQKYGVTPEQGI